VRVGSLPAAGALFILVACLEVMKRRHYQTSLHEPIPVLITHKSRPFSELPDKLGPQHLTCGIILQKQVSPVSRLSAAPAPWNLP
jgi:hypothetical protein